MDEQTANQSQSLNNPISSIPPTTPQQFGDSGDQQKSSSPKSNSFSPNVVQPPTLPPAPQPNIQTPSPDTISSPTKAEQATFATGSKQLPKSQIFFIVAIIISVIIWGIVIFLYFENKQIKNSSKQSNVLSKRTSYNQALTTPMPTVTPTVGFLPEQIELENGNIVRRLPSGESELIISKSDYKSTGIYGFSDFTISPDNQKLCIESLPPSPDPTLFYSEINGSNMNEVSFNKKNCLWTNDSNSLVYSGNSLEKEPSDIFIYNIQAGEETNLTNNETETNHSRQYDVVSLSADGSKIICKFIDLENDDDQLETSCEINIITGVIELL